ncbi:MAG: TetR/AcrR family transcriptional regulator [Bacteroidota bacterium]
MPTDTFLKLSEDKRNRFIEVALQEFAHHNFDAASVNRIVRELGIARGSVYQYFKDKLGLWQYLYEYAQQQKLTFVKAINRADFDDFWMYYRQLYKHGISFQVEQPLCYALLHRIAYLERSPSVLDRTQSWQQQAKAALAELVKAEQQSGHISSEISIDAAVALMIATSQAIADLWLAKNHDSNEFDAVLDEIIELLKKALH